MTECVSSSDPTMVGRMRSMIVRAVLVGGLVGLLLSFLAADLGRRAVFDGWQNLSPREISTDNVVVVLIDDEGMDELGAWPWSRYVMARLIEDIGRGNPKAIGIDIYFTQEDPLRPEAFASLYIDEELSPSAREEILALPQMDAALAQVIGQTPSVLARAGIDYGTTDPADLFFDNTLDGAPPSDIRTVPKVVASIPALDAVAQSHGMVDIAPDSDGIVRSVPLGVQLGERQAPGFALELARIASGAENALWDGQSIVMGKRVIPADAQGNMRFRMGDLPPVSDIPAWEVLTGETAPEVFTDKVVLIGVGATGTYDIVATPREAEIYGVFVQAQAVDAILTGAWLDRPHWIIALEFIAAFLLVALIAFAAVTRKSWPLVFGLVFAVSLPLISWIVFVEAGLLFDPVRPVLIGAFAAIALVLARYAAARLDRTRLAAELVEERVQASAQKGELEAARRIQMGMVPSENALARLDSRVDVAGILRPAKSVGGDFFDAVKISDDLLLVLVADVTGKGVPAALFMALSKALSKGHLTHADDGFAQAFTALNSELMAEADEEMGLTMLVGTLNCANGAVELINAGHENPMIVRADGSVQPIVMKGGPPLCVIDFPYQAEPVTLEAGDTLIAISDGATEAINEAGALLGSEGVLAALRANNNGCAQSQAGALEKMIADYEGSNDATDDLTILALRYIGSPSV